MKNTGTLRIQTFAARQSAPMEGVTVAVQGDGFTLHRNGHPLHGGRLACRKGLDAESSGVFHGDTLLCW